MSEPLGSYKPQELEEEVLAWWRQNAVYEKAKQLGVGKQKFYFLDGPPYVTNIPHVGTAWNKILKDAILRYKRMAGFDVHDKPGYDCHGLPIEVRVEETLKIQTKREIETKMGVEKFIEKCKEFARTYERYQTEIFRRLGVWMDWSRPYLTYLDEYIESVWWTIKKAHEKGLLERGYRVVHWCPRCETALAGYEITDEYRTVRDPSIYVKFPVEGRENEYLLIWTTTPWTLPANMAIIVHPDYDYVRAQVGGEVYILASACCDRALHHVPHKILAVFKGRELEGLRYQHPLLEEVPTQQKFRNHHRVLLSSEYVTLEVGTGCVHSAPGHGEEDYEVGTRYSLPVFAPVDSTGKFTEEGGKYAGKYVKGANHEIIEDLRSRGLLFREETVDHRYPHCWRCKTPLLLRATDQWFVKVTRLKDDLIAESEGVTWIPEWAGSRRFRDWLEGIRDWVISRQRYWGVPLPIWICERCSKWSVVGSRKELKQRAISLPKKLELHKPWVDFVELRCKCGGTMRRVPDVVDVWVDSGVAPWASIGYPRDDGALKRLWPVDLVLEGHDQTRGWFYSMLGAGMVSLGHCPYRAVLVHGHTLDEEGRRMSKSLGNFVAPEDVITKYGADALRLYQLKCTVWEDFCFKRSEVESAFSSLNIVWNTFSFGGTYMGLDKFDPSGWTLEGVAPHLKLEDRWILSELQSLISKVSEAMERYLVHEALRTIEDFLLNDVSRWYIKLIRRRVWIEPEDPEKLSAYATLYEVLKTSLLLLAPFVPFVAEAIYQRFVRKLDPTAPESVHLCSWPKVEKRWIDERLKKDMEVARDALGAVIQARNRAKLKLRWPTKTVIIVPINEDAERSLRRFSGLLKQQANCSELIIEEPCVELELPPSFVQGEGSYCRVYVDRRRTPDLMAAAWAREAVRRIQLMRKELDLRVDKYVGVVIATRDQRAARLLGEFSDYIAGEVRARQIAIAPKEEAKTLIGALSKRFEVEGEPFEVYIVEAS